MSDCQKPMHKSCRCVRPAGHQGECNCSYRVNPEHWSKVLLDAIKVAGQ